MWSWVLRSGELATGHRRTGCWLRRAGIVYVVVIILARGELPVGKCGPVRRSRRAGFGDYGAWCRSTITNPRTVRLLARRLPGEPAWQGRGVLLAASRPRRFQPGIQSSIRPSTELRRGRVSERVVSLENHSDGHAARSQGAIPQLAKCIIAPAGNKRRRSDARVLASRGRTGVSRVDRFEVVLIPADQPPTFEYSAFRAAGARRGRGQVIKR